MTETWLRCVITPGQFTGEYAVEGETSSSEGFSLFADESDLDCREFPTGSDRVPAWLRVDEIDRRGSLALVKLPRHTMENGDTVTVNVKEMKVLPAKRQEA